MNSFKGNFKDYVINSNFGRSRKLEAFLQVLDDSREDETQPTYLSPTLNNLYKPRAESNFSMDMPSIILNKKRTSPDKETVVSSSTTSLMIEMTFLSEVPFPVQLIGPWFVLNLEPALDIAGSEGFRRYPDSIDISSLTDFNALTMLKHLLIDARKPYVLEAIVIKSWNGTVRRAGRPIVAIFTNRSLYEDHDMSRVEIIVGVEDRASSFRMPKIKSTYQIKDIHYSRSLNPATIID
jgi:hypothetical protein